MNCSLNRSLPKGSARKRSIENNRTLAKHKRRSLRLQHSVSLHIPIEDLDSTNVRMNCYIDMPQQVFSLTYLDTNNTQNPETLDCLQELKNKQWQTFLVGHLYNFSYKLAQIKSLEKALTNSLTIGFQTSNMTFHSQVTVADHFSPTENDQKALKLSVTGCTDERESLIYQGYLLSWCNPVKTKVVMLPILLCRGNKKYRSLVHSVISERFDVVVKPFDLTQEEFMHLSTYCLIMLNDNDTYKAALTYKIPSGTVKLVVAVEYLLKLWKRIHKDDSNEVELDEVILFHEALETFYESTYGVKLGCAHYMSLVIQGVLSFHINTQMWLRSTRILHVVLKYLNYLAVQRLKVRALDYVDDINLTM